MRSNLRLAALALGLTFAATGAFAPIAHAQAPEIAKRQADMKGIGAAVGQIAPVIRNERPWDAAAVGAQVQTIVTNLNDIKTLFPAGSTSENSRALPAIWEKKADFDAAQARAAGVAANLAQLAAANNEAGFRAAFPQLGQACGACHTPFRRP